MRIIERKEPIIKVFAVVCAGCGSKLEFDSNDIRQSIYTAEDRECVSCPVCLREIDVEASTLLGTKKSLNKRGVRHGFGRDEAESYVR